MSYIGNKIKDTIRNWLAIVPSPGSSITIQETNTFAGNCFLDLIWYRGDASELHQFYTQFDDNMGKSKFWAAESSNGVNFRKIHTGLPAMIIDMIADIVVNSFNKITINNNNDAVVNWKKISEDNEFKNLMKQAIIDVLVQGDGSFKISYDTDISEFPIIEFYAGNDIEYIYNRGRITGVIFKTNYNQKGIIYELHEIYTITGISYELYKDGNKLEDYKILDQTKNLEEIIDNNFMMAIPIMFNKSKKFKGRGQSIFDKKLDSFDSFDEVWSQWVEALRDNRTTTYIPEDLLPVDSNGNILAPNSFDRRFTKIASTTTETESDKITVKNPTFDYEGMLQSYITALDLCLQGIISPSTLGIDVKKLDNADAQREKEKATQYTRSKILDILEKAIPKLVIACLKTYDKSKNQTPSDYEVAVDFKEYANPSFEAVVETVSKARPGQSIMSIEKAVDTMYGDSLTEGEKKDEVLRLKEEAGIIEKEEPNIV